MKYTVKEDFEWDTSTIEIILDNGEFIAKRTFINTGLTQFQLSQALKHMLFSKGIVYKNDLDNVAREFNSTADIVLNNLYKIDDLLNYTFDDWKKGNIHSIYFKKIENEDYYIQISKEEADLMIEKFISSNN